MLFRDGETEAQRPITLSLGDTASKWTEAQAVWFPIALVESVAEGTEGEGFPGRRNNVTRRGLEQVSPGFPWRWSCRSTWSRA